MGITQLGNVCLQSLEPVTLAQHRRGLGEEKEGRLWSLSCWDSVPVPLYCVVLSPFA